ncbi:MAG TPA: AMIN domain-containing protein, partial [Epulopiscium sp.]|nr:AMIN domain-containing protein [Candidatus Epulonipiscium sp.]
MILSVDDQDVWIDGEIKQIDVPPKIINDKLMLPLRFIGETLGYKVDWDHETSSIKINQNKPKPLPPTPSENVNPAIELISVTDVRVDNRNDGISSYTIYFEDPIDSYTDFQDKGKVVIDIDRAKNLLAPSTTLPTNPYVDKVRTSQFTADKTRVVFDLKAGANSHVNLSRDRMSLTIEMEPTVLKNISVGNNNVGAFIVFPGMVKAQMNVFTLEDPDRLVIDMPMTEIDSSFDLGDIEGECVSEARMSADSQRTRIVLNLHGATPYEVIEKNNEVMVQLSKPIKKSSRNIKYESAPQEIFSFKKPAGLTIDEIKIKDDYRNHKITITLPENYSDLYDDGMMSLGSTTLDKILVKSSSQTEFIIHEKVVQAVDIRDDGENIQIVLMAPREKYDKIVMLDMGHGAQDPGASANGLVEKTLNLQQGMVVYDLLEKDPRIKVYVTRVDDSYPTNPYRAQLANEIGADIFVSMHNNSFTPATKGTEVYYSTRSMQGKQIAEIVQRNMVNQLGTHNRGAKNGSHLIVLNQTKMPAILIETAFMSNLEDAERLKSPAFNQQVGFVIYESL